MVFDRWTILNGALNADDAEKFETGRTLEEFAFTMPAEPLEHRGHPPDARRKRAPIPPRSS